MVHKSGIVRMVGGRGEGWRQHTSTSWAQERILVLLLVYFPKISKFVVTINWFQLSTFSVCRPVVTIKYFLLYRNPKVVHFNTILTSSQVF